MVIKQSAQPVGKMERVLSSGGIAAKVGGKVLLHYAKRPFMQADARRRDEEEMIRKSAQTLFAGLALLKGTALKMAQQLSLELDMLPEAVCRELSKACHQVPPINRALVRRVIIDALGRPPEKMFQQLDLTAFAAASLGQVHAGRDDAGTALAVKIQYPAIAATIKNDVQLLRQLLRPLMAKDQLLSALTEVSDRLHEEVNYRKEAENIVFFAEQMKIEKVCIPCVREKMSAATVLTTTLMPGIPLDQWLSSLTVPATDCCAFMSGWGRGSVSETPMNGKVTGGNKKMKKVRQFHRVPEHSIIARNISGPIDYIDAFSIPLEKHHPYSIDDITWAVFTSFPGWADMLLKLRDALVKPFGLMTGSDIEPQVSATPRNYKIGEQAVIFMVIDRTDTEIVMSENDAHLCFRTSLSLVKNDKTENDTLFLTTLVQFHNICGKLYFVPVKPFHKLIMKSLLLNFWKTHVHRKAALIS